MKRSDYLQILTQRYASPDGIDDYIQRGARNFWNIYEAKNGITPPNLKNTGVSFIEDYYTRCFHSAIDSHGATDQGISYKQFFTHQYNARLAPLLDSELIVIDASLYSSFVVYFCCIYHLAFSKPSASQRTRIVEIFICEVEFHLACLRGQKGAKQFSSEAWIELSSTDKDIMVWTAMSAECLLLYIILHELGHIHYGHKELGAKDIEESLFKIYNKEHELEADTFASQHLYKILEKDNIHNLTLDFVHIPVLFFKVLDLIDIYKCEVLRESSMVSEYYPTFAEREMALEKWEGISPSLLDQPSEAINYLKSLIILASQSL